MVKRERSKGVRIYYARRPQLETAEDKLAFLGKASLGLVPIEEIRPDAKSNWINLSENNFEELVPIANKETKAAKSPSRENAIFKLYSLGVATNRDDWVYDFDKGSLSKKVQFLGSFEQSVGRDDRTPLPSAVLRKVQMDI